MDRLRYFSAFCVRGPMSIDSWKNIETLKYIRQEDWMRCNSRPTASHHVRKLGLLLDPRKGRDELSRVRASLEKMESLVKLYLLWNPFYSIDTAVIPHLGNLTKLKLKGKMNKCPAARIFPQNLSHLTLKSAVLHEDPMPELGKLPKLLYLKLSERAYRGERMKVLHDGFPCLESLYLRAMYRLRVIDIEEGGMPHLKQLRVQHCPALEKRARIGKEREEGRILRRRHFEL